MKRVLHKEDYKGLKIEIQGRFKSKVSTWDNGITDVVYLDYYVFTKLGSEYRIDTKLTTQSWKVEKEKPFKFLFWTIHPKLTFEQQVREEIPKLIQYIKDKVDKDQYEKEMTEGLLDSLKEDN